MTTHLGSTRLRAGLARQALGHLLLAVVVLAAILFLTAGTLHYWEAWLYMAVLFLPLLGFLFYMINRAPDFLERRMRYREKEKTQSVALGVAGASLILVIILPGFDQRFGWSTVPVWAVIAADVVILLGYALFTLVMKENRYASRIIEVDQGQTVSTTGPYAIIRHPMYVAVLLIFEATPIALGSWWAALPVLVLPYILAVRIRTEEATLARELDGYEEYAQKVRYRLIPGIW